MDEGRDAGEQRAAREEDAPVRVSGLLRGTELSGEGRVALSPPNIELQAGTRLIVLRLTSLDGLELRGDVALMHLTWGDVLEFRAELPDVGSLKQFVAAVTRATLALPELTASLRSYGSPRAGAGPAQEMFFAPLRDALVEAVRTERTSDAATIFSSDRIGTALETQLARLAALRFPGHPPERRALEAELSDCTAAVMRRIDVLRETQRSLERASANRRFVAWRRWSAALVDLFSAHDACWPLVRSSLDAATLPAETPGRRWKRWRPFASGSAGEEEP
jgi:hypothetical protein